MNIQTIIVGFLLLTILVICLLVTIVIALGILRIMIISAFDFDPLPWIAKKLKGKQNGQV